MLSERNPNSRAYRRAGAHSPASRHAGPAKRLKTRHRGVYYRLDSKGRRRYVIWYADSDSRGRYKTLPLGTTEQQAVTERAKLLEKLSRGVRVAPSRETVQEFADWWLEEIAPLHLKPATIERYKTNLKRINHRLGKKRLTDVTRDDVVAFVRDLQREELKGWSIQNLLVTLSSMFSEALAGGKVSINPVSQLHRRERPKRNDVRKHRILERDEIQLLLNHSNPRYRLILQTYIFTGLRREELTHLRWEDVDFEAGVMRVRSSKTSAGEREVVLMPALQRALAARSLEQTPPSEWVFPNRHGKPIDGELILINLKKAAEKAGIPNADKLRVHDLRHTYATLLISNPDVDIAFASKQIGHSNISTTLNVYADAYDRRAKTAKLREQLEAEWGGIVESVSSTPRTGADTDNQSEAPEPA